MARRPSFQFYGSDWLSNRKLCAAGFTLKGIWIDVMSHMMDSEEFGLLRVDLSEIASAVHCHLNQLESLVRRGILKGAPAGKMTAPFHFDDKLGVRHLVLPPQPGPCWFSSRMLEDEFKRARDRENGRLGGNPNLLNTPPPRVNPLVNPDKKGKGKVNESGNGVGVGGVRESAPRIVRNLADWNARNGVHT